jgi:hypothetical protein
MAGEIRNDDHRVITHNDELNRAPPVDYRADLPFCLKRHLRERPGEFRVDDTIRRYFSSIEVFQPFDLVRLEACCIAVYFRLFSPCEINIIFI